MRMGVNIRDINPKQLGLNLEGGNFTIRKEAIMMGNGNKIICMAMANYTMLIPNQPIKVNGTLIGFMVKEKYIMINLMNSIPHSIIQTLTTYRNNGITIREL